MATKRVHEIAKERGMSSKDVLLKLRAAGMDVTAAAAEVDEAEALRALASNGTTRAGAAPLAPCLRARRPAAAGAAPRPSAGLRPASAAQAAAAGPAGRDAAAVAG